MSDGNIITEVTSKEELDDAITSLEGDIDDLSLEIDDDPHSDKAKELIDDIQERANQMHAFIYKDKE